MKRKGFTLIELLAVIIILGILMLIAIPSVTSYINNSRKQSYVSTIKELIKGASNLVNDGELDMFDTKTTYYIHVDNIELESGKAQSPYDEFDEAYIVVTYDGEDFDYYYLGKDEANQGIDEITELSDINEKSIGEVSEVSTNVGIDDKTTIVVIDENGNRTSKNATERVIKKLKPLCKRATSLHTTSCESLRDGYCYVAGYTAWNKGTTIKYGNLGTEGELHSGDAFDCDVNGDGIYSSATERFYYVSDFYDSNLDEPDFNHDYAALIYYTSFYNNEPSDTGAVYATGEDTVKLDYRCTGIDNVGCNRFGPVSAVKHLPKVGYWIDGLLYNKSRQIMSYHVALGTEFKKVQINNNLLPSFSYDGYAARLIKIPEVYNACYDGTTSIMNPRGLDNCNYLLEGTNYSDSSKTAAGIMTEDVPYSGSYESIHLYANDRSANSTIWYLATWGVKPVIDVPKDRIEY